VINTLFSQRDADRDGERKGNVMADGMMMQASSPTRGALSRIIDEFAFLPNQVLNGMVNGAPAGYISPALAAAIIDGRQALAQSYETY